MNARGVIQSLAVVLAFSVSCSRSPSYLSFIEQNSAYYARIAAACEEVRIRTPVELANGLKIFPDRISLPTALRELHPDYLRVSTNRVFVSVGVGRGSYGVAWQPVGISSWELRSYAENLERLLFTKGSR